MSPFDMHRHPFFFILCLNVAFVAGIVIAEDRRLEEERAQATPQPMVAQATPPTCTPDTRSWLAQTFQEPPAAAQRGGK